MQQYIIVHFFALLFMLSSLAPDTADTVVIFLGGPYQLQQDPEYAVHKEPSHIHAV